MHFVLHSKMMIIVEQQQDTFLKIEKCFRKNYKTRHKTLIKKYTPNL